MDSLKSIGISGAGAPGPARTGPLRGPDVHRGAVRLLGHHTGAGPKVKCRRWILMSVCVTLPIIILFFLVQRTFIQGITLTGIKG